MTKLVRAHALPMGGWLLLSSRKQHHSISMLESQQRLLLHPSSLIKSACKVGFILIFLKPQLDQYWTEQMKHFFIKLELSVCKLSPVTIQTFYI